MLAKFVFFSHDTQTTERDVASVQEARGLAKKTLRRLGSVAWSTVRVDGLSITISQREGQWHVTEESAR